MKKIIVALFAASTLLVGAPITAIAGVDVAAVCDGSVPEAWNRPGGYCDQNDFNKSLSGPSAPGCVPHVNVGMIGSDRGARMLVATPPSNGCCETLTQFNFAPSKDRVIVATRDPCNNN